MLKVFVGTITSLFLILITLKAVSSAAVPLDTLTAYLDFVSLNCISNFLTNSPSLKDFELNILFEKSLYF